MARFGPYRALESTLNFLRIQLLHKTEGLHLNITPGIYNFYHIQTLSQFGANEV